jgi:hypothetical protein
MIQSKHYQNWDYTQLSPHDPKQALSKLGLHSAVASCTLHFSLMAIALIFRLYLTQNALPQHARGRKRIEAQSRWAPVLMHYFLQILTWSVSCFVVVSSSSSSSPPF